MTTKYRLSITKINFVAIILSLLSPFIVCWASSEYELADEFITYNETDISSFSQSSSNEPVARAPEWMYQLVDFRKRLFLRTVEPIIVFLLGPVDETLSSSSSGFTTTENPHPTTNEFHTATFNSTDDESMHRRLGFLPSYVEDVSKFRETSMSFATLAIMFITMSFMVLVFMSCFYHNQKTSPLFISPRRHRLPKLVPPPLPVDGAFSWIRVCFFMSDEEIINRIGFDSLIFLRFHRLGLRCIVKMCAFSFFVLLPLNFTGGGHANASDLKGYVGTLLFTDFLRFTMANVSGGSPRLWVHCFAAYLQTAIVCRELMVEYNAFNNIRHRYLLSKESHLRTVLVSNIPRHLRSAKKITTYFKHVYPEAVKSVSICQNLIRLEKLVSKRTSILAQIEKELLILCRNEKRKLVGHTGFDKVRISLSTWNLLEKLLCCDGSQERLSKLYSKLEILNDKVEKEQIRRHRVMKRMDTMEAGDGSKDIDYILASPFIGSSPDQLKTMGIESWPEWYDEVLPASIGAPRNPDGSLKKRYQPPSLDNVLEQGRLAQHAQGQGLEVPPEAEVPHAMSDDSQLAPQHDVPLHYNAETGEMKRPSGPFIRPTATRQQSTQNNLETSNHSHSNTTLSHISAVSTVDPDFFDSTSSSHTDDTKKKVLRRPFSKAGSAIRRYSRFARETSFFGKPTIPTDGKKSLAFKHDDHIEDHTNEVCDKAFVVMRTFTASTIAIQSMHSSKPGSMEVTTAPEPRDILWDNIYFSKGAKRTRAYIGEVIVLFLISFYVIPVALVSLLVSESALVSSSPRLAQLDQASALFSSAIAMVQPMCLVGIQQLVPPLLIAIGKAEGIVAFSEVQMRAFSRYFLFQVLNSFLVTAIAGSIFDTVAIIIENPEAAFEMLGNSLPKMSSFFITFVIMKTFLGLGVELVRTMSLIQAVLRYILFPMSTLRAHRSVRIGMRAIDDPGWFPYHKVLAQDMLVVVVSVVFAVVAPLVLFPCALFCLFSRVMWTHHLLYVYESCFETGGQFWPKIFRRFVFGLIIAQATITGQFILKEARHEAYGTIILMCLTYVFLRSTRARYDAASHTLPLEVATVMDISVSQEEEARRRMQQQEAHNKSQGAYQDRENSHQMKYNHFSSIDSNVGEEEHIDNNLGSVIGDHDPFELAYVQPALRANPRARPEQPFPPSQLGREEIFLRTDNRGGSMVSDEDALDSKATVRLKFLNREDRKIIDRWWNDQMTRAGDQHILSILTGEESGTLLIGNSVPKTTSTL